MKKVISALILTSILSGCGFNVEKKLDEEVVVDPEIVGRRAYEEQSEKLTIKNCSECHGVNLEGKMGPPLEDIGSEMTREQIKDAIINGIGTMPKQNVTEEQADAITDWLSNQKKLHSEKVRRR